MTRRQLRNRRKFWIKTGNAILNSIALVVAAGLFTCFTISYLNLPIATLLR